MSEVIQPEVYFLPAIHTREPLLEDHCMYSIVCGDCGTFIASWQRPAYANHQQAERHLGSIYAHADPCPCKERR